MRNVLLHPFGLTLLITSVVLAGLMFIVLDRWSGQAPWVLLVGVLAYSASTVVLHRWRTVGINSIETEETDPVAPEDEDEAGEPQDNWRLFQQALQRLNNPGFLAQCELVSILPKTLASVSSQIKGAGTPEEELAPLEKAKALREVLIAAIEALRPSAEITGDSALHFHILHEAYVNRRPVAYILAHYHIGEAHYHRQRRYAIRALAGDLQHREELIRDGAAKSTGS